MSLASKRYFYVFIFLLFFGALLTACSENTNVEDDKETEKGEDVGSNDDEKDIVIIEDEEIGTPENPIIVNVIYPWGEDQFNQRFMPVEEALGNVDIVYHWYDGTSSGLQELFAGGVHPDIIFSIPDNIGPLEELDMIYPLDDLVEQMGFDLSRINPALLSLVKGFDSQNRLIGFPDGTGFFALYFNKEIFDLFGQEYPDTETPMTWQQALDLARAMTGERNNQMYIGLEFGGWGNTGDVAKVPLRQFGVAMTDRETGEVLITSKPEFTRFLELMREYYNIPGMRSEMALSADNFVTKTAAMTIHWHNYFDYGWGDMEYQANMDIAPVPVWEDLPNTGPYLGTAVMAISTYSKNKVTAFKVLAQYLSKENQINISRTMASGPAVIDPEVLEQFGKALEQYKDRNTEHVYFSLTPAEFDSYSHYDRFVPFDLTKFADSDIDIPTFLREVKEEAETLIQEFKDTN